MSNVCLPDGSCADPAQVAYVQQGGTGTAPCTKAAPCGTLDDGVKANKPTVKIAAGTVADMKTTVIDGKAVTILADPGAKLSRSDVGVILQVQNDGADVKIFDLEFTDGTGSPNPAISIPIGGAPKLTLTRVVIDGNQGVGISAASAGVLTISQSTVSKNTGGGINVTNGTFVIVGNVFYLNGTGAGNIGGVNIQTIQSSTNRLEFNTFNQNATVTGIAPAINCVAGTFTAKYNIMSGNGTLTQMDQVGGTCAHMYSIATPGLLPPGTGNSSSDPLFVNATKGELHIQPGSPARHAADAGADLTGIASRDIDGDLRISPADIGADQVKP
jgi:hypothetical protein